MPSPKAKPIIDLDFYRALKLVTEGKKIRRPEWPEKVHACIVNDNLSILLGDGLYHPWTVSSSDLAACDWRIDFGKAIQ